MYSNQLKLLHQRLKHAHEKHQEMSQANTLSIVRKHKLHEFSSLYLDEDFSALDKSLLSGSATSDTSNSLSSSSSSSKQYDMDPSNLTTSKMSACEEEEDEKSADVHDEKSSSKSATQLPEIDVFSAKYHPLLSLSSISFNKNLSLSNLSLI